jgi:predicted alpha/beta-fold hydrolase
VPTTILAAHDDPMVDPQPLRQAVCPAAVTAHLVDGGGHLGFVSRGGNDPDHWWLDWRVVDWVLHT